MEAELQEGCELTVLKMEEKTCPRGSSFRSWKGQETVPLQTSDLQGSYKNKLVLLQATTFVMIYYNNIEELGLHFKIL